MRFFNIIKIVICFIFIICILYAPYPKEYVELDKAGTTYKGITSNTGNKDIDIGSNSGTCWHNGDKLKNIKCENYDSVDSNDNTITIILRNILISTTSYLKYVNVAKIKTFHYDFIRACTATKHAIYAWGKIIKPFTKIFGESFLNFLILLKKGMEHWYKTTTLRTKAVHFSIVFILITLYYVAPKFYQFFYMTFKKIERTYIKFINGIVYSNLWITIFSPGLRVICFIFLQMLKKNQGYFQYCSHILYILYYMYVKTMDHNF